MSWRMAMPWFPAWPTLANSSIPWGWLCSIPSGSTLPIWKVIGAILVLVGVSVAAFAWRRHFPYLFVGWFWYLGMLVPVIGLVQVGSHAMATATHICRRSGCASPLLGAAQAVASWPAGRWMCGVASAVAVLILMGCAWRQTSYWHDSETLWKRQSGLHVAKRPCTLQPRQPPVRTRAG